VSMEWKRHKLSYNLLLVLSIHHQLTSYYVSEFFIFYQLNCPEPLPTTFVHKLWREFEAPHCPATPNVF
ncbi:MAG TPA: hypothetical protein VEW65_10730, partial [Chryseolinea sp.]|nr:hypothetical protein [Chryseolinea sp.]